MSDLGGTPQFYFGNRQVDPVNCVCFEICGTLVGFEIVGLAEFLSHGGVGFGWFEVEVGVLCA